MLTDLIILRSFSRLTIMTVPLFNARNFVTVKSSVKQLTNIIKDFPLKSTFELQLFKNILRMVFQWLELIIHLQ